MTDTETVDAIRAILAPVDLHRNRERREAIDAIRELLDVPEGIVGEPEPVATVEAPAEPEAAPDAPVPSSDGLRDTPVDWNEMDLPDAAHNGEPEPVAEEPVKRGPGRPRKTPAIAED